jgi:outer membrane protein assembly complex protein YaeT
MFGRKTIRRALLLCAASVAVLAALFIGVVHTGVVRRFALVRIQVLLERTQRLVLEATDLDYNLFQSHYELKNVVLRGSGLADLPAPVRAKRVTVTVPMWDLVRGSFDAARIRIDGLSVRLVTLASGRRNLPTPSGSRGCPQPGGPAVAITNAEIAVDDEPSGVSIQLPTANASAGWDASARTYRMAIETSGGRLQWRDLRLPLDYVRLKSAMAGCGFSVESLRIGSADSKAEITGALNSSSSSIQATASLDLDSRYLGQALPIKVRPAGRLQAQLRATGPLDGFQVTGDVRLPQFAIGNILIRRPALDATFNTSNGEVRIRSLSAGLFAGQLRATGALWTGAKPGRSELKVNLTGVSPRQIADAFGTSGFPSVPVALQLAASCSGLDWRHSRASGTIRSAPAEIGFHAALDQARMHAVLDASVGDNAHARGDVVIDLDNQSVAGPVGGSVASLGRLGGQIEEALGRPAGTVVPVGLDGSFNWTATLSGTLRAPAASLQLHGDRLSFDRWQGVELDVDAHYSPQQIEIGRAQVFWQGQQITAKGKIGGASADAPLNLQASLTSPSVARVLQQLGVAVPVQADLSGDIQIAGTVSHPSAEGTFHADTVSVWSEPLSRVSVEASWQNGILTVKRLTASQDHGPAAPGELELTGSLEPVEGRFTANLEVTNFFPPEPAPGGGLAFTGAFDLTAKGDGTLSDANLQSDITGRDLRAGQIQLGNVIARLDASSHQAKIRLDLPELNTHATGTFAMDGTWPFEFALKGKNTHLATSPAATFDVTLRGNGSVTKPEASSATASIQNLRLATAGQEIVSDGPVDLSFADGRIRVNHMAMKAGESKLQLNGEIPVTDKNAPGSVAVAATLRLDSLAQFLPALGAAQVTGVAELNATVRGTAANLEPEGSIAIRDGSFRNATLPFSLENIAGKVNIEKGLIRLDELACKAGTGTFSAEGSLPLRLFSDVFSAPASNPDQPARLTARVEKLELTSGTGKHRSTTTLSLKLAGKAPKLSLAALHGTVDFDELVIRTGEHEIRQSTPTRIAVADSAMRLEHLDLRGPNGTLHGSGSMGLTGTFPLQADLDGGGDLVALSPFVSPIETSGSVRFDLHLKGTWSDPQANGYLELDQASLMVPNPLLQAEAVKLRADFDGDRVSLKELSGRLNGGSFTGGGDLNLGGGGIRADLFLNGKDVFAEIPAGLKTNNSLDLKLVSQKDQLVLEGRIEVQEGFFESPLDLLSRSPKGMEVTTVKTESASSHPVGLDLRIITRRPVEMNNNLGRVSGTADLRLTGTLDQVRMLGGLRLEPDGRLYFGDRIYYVERGTVRFVDAPQITPELDILAYTRTSNYTIHLGLTGAPGDVTSTFTSDPPLSREDVISVLLTGKTVADNKGVDVRTLEAVSVASGAMSAALSSRLRHTFGVSRVSIQPSAIAAESNPGTRVTLSQDFTDTFRIMYSTNLTDSSDQIWVGEYDLTRALTTRLVKQSDNTYRGEFRHDVRFGTATGSEVTEAVRAAKRKVSAVNFTGESPFPEDVLAKKFKVKAGKDYDALKVRKGVERLDNFFVKKGYLESRVRLDRDDTVNGVALTVRIELGPAVEMTFQGANLPRGEKSKLRNLWHAGISDRQRPLAAKNAVLDYFARKGYLRAQADPKITDQGNHRVVHFDMRPGIHYRDVKVLVQGAAPERMKDVRSLIGERHLEVGADRDPSRLAAAVTRYYQQRGYLAVKVDPPLFDLDEEGRKGRIVVPITEGPVFHVGAIEFSGNQALTGDSLRAGLPVEAGQVFEPARLEPAATAIRSKYGKLGYRTARIDYAIARHDDRDSVDLRFNVVENKQTSIRSVKIAGNRQTSVKFAQGRLLIAEGEVADTSKIRESVTNLSRTGAYAAANIDVQVAPEPPESKAPAEASPTDTKNEAADVTVGLVEPKPFRLLYGGLYDSGSGPGFIFDLQNLNSLGPGRTLGLRARYDSETKEARIYLTQPYWGLKRVSTTISTYFTNQVPYGQDYPTAKAGVGFEQDWPSRGKLLFGYGIRFEKERAWLPVHGVEVRTPIVYAAPLTFTVSREARDSFLDATRGSFTSHSFEFAPSALGTQFPYIRYYLQYFKYFPLTRPRPVPYGETPNRSRLVFATGTRIGMQKGLNSKNVVLTDRFYAGGGTTVRGFQQDSLGPKLANGAPIGGNAVVILNNELRYPLFWVFDAVSFVDIGNVFPQTSDFRFSELRKAGGFGLRVRNPFVVLRFDYGFKLDRQPGEKIGAFFFSIGQAF